MSSRSLPIVLTDEAQDDIESIALTGIQNWGEEQAKRYQAAIEDVLDSLSLFPEMGRRTASRSGNVRTISIGRHVIVYRVEDDTVRVLRVLHGRMDIGRYLDP